MIPGTATIVGPTPPILSPSYSFLDASLATTVSSLTTPTVNFGINPRGRNRRYGLIIARVGLNDAADTRTFSGTIAGQACTVTYASKNTLVIGAATAGWYYVAMGAELPVSTTTGTATLTITGGTASPRMFTLSTVNINATSLGSADNTGAVDGTTITLNINTPSAGGAAFDLGRWAYSAGPTTVPTFGSPLTLINTDAAIGVPTGARFLGGQYSTAQTPLSFSSAMTPRGTLADDVLFWDSGVFSFPYLTF